MTSERKMQEKGAMDFLLALNVGETHEFPNMPTLTEARRHVPPSVRQAYKRISVNVSNLMRRYPDHRFSTTLAETKGSRIFGNLVVVKLVARGSAISTPDDFEAIEAKRQRSIESWKQRKIAEDAPKLPGELERAEAVDVARRTAGAIRHQEEAKLRLVTQRYDPKKIAMLVAASLRGETIERLVDECWLIDPNPTWEEPTGHYRIKPKIREWFLIVGRDGRITASAETITGLPHHDPDCRVRVREIPEDDA